MGGKRRHSVTTIEKHEFWIVKKPVQQTPKILCRTCQYVSGMLTPREAAAQAGVSQRTVYRWIEDGRVHFAETEDGELFVCLAPLST